MNDNLFGSTVFALIVAIAIGAATAIAGAEIDLERATVQASATGATPAAPASAAVPAHVELPLVMVTGHRQPHEAADDAIALAAVAPGLPPHP